MQADRPKRSRVVVVVKTTTIMIMKIIGIAVLMICNAVRQGL